MTTIAPKIVAIASPDSYDAYNRVFDAHYLLHHTDWNAVNTLAKILRGHGFELVVYAFSESGQPGLYSSSDGQFWVRLIRPSKLSLKLLGKGPLRYLGGLINAFSLLRPLLEDSPKAILNTHFPHFPRGELLSIFAKITIKRFGYLQSITLPGSSPYDYVGQIFQHFTDFYILTEPEAAAECRRRYKISQNKIYLVGLLPHIAFDRQATPTRRRSQTRKTILYVGRLEDSQKAVSNLIKAFEQIAPSEPQAHLAIVGDGSDRQMLQSLAEKTGLAERIHFYGWVSREELAAQYRSAHLFCLPSRRESYALVVTEAMLAGLPVVCTDLPALRDRVVDGVTALTVQVDDVDGLAQRLLQLLKDERQAARLAENAQTKTEQIVAQTQTRLAETLRQIASNEPQAQNKNSRPTEAYAEPPKNLGRQRLTCKPDRKVAQGLREG